MVGGVNMGILLHGLGALALVAACFAAPAAIDFNQDIRPILSGTCFSCHGPHADARKADLRLDLANGLFGAGRRGQPIIEPGNAAGSLLIQRINAPDRDDRMPPATALHQLSQEDRDLLSAWVDQGAQWSKHWAFSRPAAAPVPQPHAQWTSHNDIDRYIHAGLVEQALSPSPQADAETLLRRVTLDLTGLPPTIQALDAYLADSNATDDVETLWARTVDTLLASPQFGERMATTWLDLARYADTYGYQSDVGRTVWPWRDWVIQAFNENLPFDDFLTWQLAGDLLPNPTRNQQLATTFNRLHRQTNEGGSVEEEYRVEYVADRVNTFGNAMLGLTTECARCHDHKFDPISQREYYELFAFFDNIDESGLYSHFTSSVPTPTLRLSTDAQSAALVTLATDMGTARAELSKRQTEARAAFELWLAQDRLDMPLSVPGLVGHYPLDAIDKNGLVNLVEGGKPGSVSGAPLEAPGIKDGGIQLNGDNKIALPDVGAFVRSAPFTLSLHVSVPARPERTVVMHRSRSWTDAGSQGYQLLLEHGCPSWSLVHFWPGNAISIRAMEPLKLDRFNHIVVTSDGSSSAAGLAIYIDGTRAETETIRDNLYKGITGGGPGALTIGERFRDIGLKDGTVDEVKVFARCLTAIEVAHLHNGVALDEALQSNPEALFDYFTATVDEPCAEASTQLEAAHSALAQAQDGVQEIMAMRETAPRQTFLLKRGNYGDRGVAVQPGTPDAVLPFDEALPANRLGLAQWVTDPANPLTARVAVNRLWKVVFGTGLVATPGDFGSQGGVPSHPALLDALALEFIASGWDVKAMVRRMVLSATYQQVASESSDIWRADPGNRWLARGSSRRLSAEMMRDQALAASGLLVERIGGAGAFPYQPAGLWKDKGSATYPQGTGESLYRRSLYTYWKRTSPPPSMMLFDAAKRDVCVAQRGSTATPLQALVLLNDVQFVEASRVLAERALREGGLAAAEQVEFAFRSLTGRRPSADERDVLAELFQSQRAAMEADPEAAALLAAIGQWPRDESLDVFDVAALTATCSTIMSTDAAAVKR